MISNSYQSYADDRLLGGNLVAPLKDSYNLFISAFQELDVEVNYITKIALRALYMLTGLVGMVLTAPIALVGRLIQIGHYYISSPVVSWNKIDNGNKIYVLTTIQDIFPSMDAENDLNLNGYWPLKKPIKAECDIFLKQVQLGCRILSEKGVNGCFGPECYSYLVVKLLMNLPVTIQDIIEMDNKAKSFVVRHSADFDKLLVNLICGDTDEDFRNKGYSLAGYILQTNLQKIQKNQVPYTTIFFPIISSGRVKHAILGVIELNPDDESQANITVIDPFGKNSGYKNCATTFAEGLKSNFPSPDTRVVFNEVRQQTDSLTCGFHQVLNIQELLMQPNVQDFVERKQLPIRSMAAIIQILHKLDS